jgi:hypothetical protein
VYNNTIDVIGRAFEERYFLCKTKDGFEPALHVRPRTYKRNIWLVSFKDIVVRICGDAPVVSLQRVVEAYTGAKRRIYQRAYESLMITPICKNDSILHSFAKYEKIDLGKVPRVINPRDARYNLTLGKYLKFLEKRVYKGINVAFGAHTPHTVIKGLNVVEAAGVIKEKWSRFLNPVAVGLDASKFDMHTSVPALRYEHSVYTSIFPQSSELKELLRWQEVNGGRAFCDDGMVKFKMHGTRSSGDLNTSLGNCIIMCGLIFAFTRERGLDVELCNNGDDCVVILEQIQLNAFMLNLPKWFVRHGYRMTVEDPVYELEQIEFCQSRPVCVDGTYRMVRNLTNSITKDPLCLVPVQTPKVLRMWYGAVGDCGLSITSGVPILQEYYKMFRRAGKAYSEGFLKHVNKNSSHMERMRGMGVPKTNAISAATRCSFYFAFGILPELQMSIESAYANTTLEEDIEDLLHEELSLDKYDNCPPSVVQHMF